MRATHHFHTWRWGRWPRSLAAFRSIDGWDLGPISITWRWRQK